MEEILVTKENYRIGLKVKLNKKGLTESSNDRTIYSIGTITRAHSNKHACYVNFPDIDVTLAYYFYHLEIIPSIIEDDIYSKLDKLAEKLS